MALFLINLLARFIAYCRQPEKPSLHLGLLPSRQPK
jgi:hypothetical protein